MKPLHPVSKSKLAQLAWLINKAIDNGNYDVSIGEVRKAADAGVVFQFMKDTLPTYRLLDLSLFTAEDIDAVNEWFLGMKGNYDTYVENKGLCLLLAWTIGMMQDAGDPEDLNAKS